MANDNGIPDEEYPITLQDLSNATGFDERYIQRRMDAQNIDYTTVRIAGTDDYRIIAQTRGGANRILYGVDSGERGRKVQFGSYRGVRYLIENRQDYPEIDKYNAQLYFPRFTRQYE